MAISERKPKPSVRLTAYHHKVCHGVWAVGIRGVVEGRYVDRPRWLLNTWATSKTAREKAAAVQKDIDRGLYSIWHTANHLLGRN